MKACESTKSARHLRGSRLLAAIGLGLAMVILPVRPGPAWAQADATRPDKWREYYLRDLFLPLSYQPGKNSYLLQDVKRGDREDLLVLEGSGSVRHLWSTWSGSLQPMAGAASAKVLLRVFVDHEKAPSIEGALEEVCLAAERTGERYAPQSAFNYQGGYNLYLPIFFRTGIRVEIEAIDDLREFYVQIDYRKTAAPESSARLVSIPSAEGLRLEYQGGVPPWSQWSDGLGTTTKETCRTWAMGAGESGLPVELEGPGIIRRLLFRGDAWEDLWLDVFWDGDSAPAVHAPLKYFFGRFRTVGLESSDGEAQCYFPMPFRKNARLVASRPEGTGRTASFELRVQWEQSDHPFPQALYFHAIYRDEHPTSGFRDFNIARIQGSGHFVGMNLFDSGSNHGGGDVALLDAAGAVPGVLHGICAEDYFSFAWHKTGGMHDYAGAPVHERRYRFHFENPYPFTDALQLNFGVFAELHPRSVAFWYQQPEAETPTRKAWIAPNVPWTVLGPLALSQALPEEPDAREYPTAILLNRPEEVNVTWQPVPMIDGFLDLCHHYRHFTARLTGTGYIAGEGHYRAVSYLHVPQARSMKWRIGHDDRLVLQVNESPATELNGSDGFHTSCVNVYLQAGWNRVSVTIENRENTNWRWVGFSLSLPAETLEAGPLRWACP